jgi:hypothetical protein
MADDQNSDEQRIPPKLVIRPPRQTVDESEQPTVDVPPVSGQATGHAKKETSRISLDAAVPPASGEKTQTIRLKPAGSTPAGVRPGVIAQKPTVQVPAAGSPVSEKRKTSRISLEDALSPGAGDGGSAPKTIRLKKPSEAAAAKLGKSATAKTAAGPAAMASTSELSKDTAGDSPLPTRKRTIRVKRPSGGRGVRVGAAEAGSAAEGAPATATAPVGEPVSVRDEPNWFFVFSSIAATLVACVLIYVLVAQALGPNVSLTTLSYGAPQMDLAWPGKIIGGR